MIGNNVHKYSVSAMCRVLQLPRQTYYYETKQRENHNNEIEKKVIESFRNSKNVYGTRKIKVELHKQGYCVSRRKIGQIMKKNGLVSVVYTVAQFKPHKQKCNEAPIENKLNREFNPARPLAVVVSDLTYVRVNKQWNYVCLLVDLFNREIIGRSVGERKDSSLVYQAFSTFHGDLKDIRLFHTDRGNEFKNKIIDDVLATFSIERSLSFKGCPYDNAVAEATYKILKTEFIRNREFCTLEELKLELDDYINWYNNRRIHGTLNYMTPKAYKLRHLKKIV